MILRCLCLILVGFIVVGPLSKDFQLCSLINARSDRESAYRLMSGTTDNANSLPPSGGDLSTEMSNAERLDCATVHGKHRWSHEENCELMRCYYTAKAAGKGYQKRL